MNVLIIGSGGREHAIAWRISKSPLLSKLYIAPGNAGTMAYGDNILLDINNYSDVICFCKEKQIALVLVGPEIPLANGLVDALSASGIRCFGPSRAAAEIEASKAFAKKFMARHKIPTARFEIFSKVEEALAYLQNVDYPVVIKASGLAAGKGVILPETSEEATSTVEAMLAKNEFGAAGREIVIEERLRGQEVSLMAFTDGVSVAPMIAAQDHKRLLDGDNGPNTGGMGAYAPASVFTKALLRHTLKSVLKPAVNGLRNEGRPFIGVLYAGLMLAQDGVRVLEFNCRFGDPEAQVVLPLLATDLIEIADACVDGRLADIDVRWKTGTAVCVVLAANGYPVKYENGKVVSFRALPEDMFCFHAGTQSDGKNIITSGGRVFGLTAWANNVETAVQKVYSNVDKFSFEGMLYRKDIAHFALSNPFSSNKYSA